VLTAGLIIIIIIAVLLLNTCKHQRQVSGGRGHYQTGADVSGLQIPATKPGEELIQHTAYTLSFNPDHEQANWVAYVLRGAQFQTAHFTRTNQFMTDPEAKPHSADDEDYEGSGYDRGHLASAEDMSWSAATMKESFYYSNMSPQVPAFNRGVWKRLEELVRFWATVYDSIYVVTGPVLTKGLSTIGHDRVSVPKYYYKVILEYNPKGTRGIGFILPHEASAATLTPFAVSIDSVEHFTGIDFFPKLPDNVEDKVEANPDVAGWYWSRKAAR
jgi:endonuclease G